MYKVLAVKTACMVLLRCELLEISAQCLILACAHLFSLSLKYGDDHSEMCCQQNLVSCFFSSPNLSYLLTDYQFIRLLKNQLRYFRQ